MNAFVKGLAGVLFGVIVLGAGIKILDASKGIDTISENVKQLDNRLDAFDSMLRADEERLLDIQKKLG